MNNLQLNCMKILFYLLFTIPLLSFGSEKLNWVDLPCDILTDILYEYDLNFDKLNELTQKYHLIGKTDWSQLDKRINALQEITRYCNEIKPKIKDKYLFNTVNKYLSIATEKANYLQKLKELKQYKYRKMKADIFNLNTITDSYIPLLLNNERKLEYKSQEFWGQYFIEAIDPCHRRQLISYYDVWLKKCKKCELLDFFIWLEDQNVSIFLPTINLLSEQELKKYRVLIKNGKFYSVDGKLITTTEHSINPYYFKNQKFITAVNFKKEPIFIIDVNQHVFLTYSDENNAHVTLSHYLPLIGSGKLYLRNGEVKKISFESGHYLPKMEHFIQTIRFFEDNGVHLDNNVDVIYYIKYKDYTNKLREFKQKYMS